MGRALWALSATQARDLIRDDAISVEDYAKSLLDRWRERDDIVKAWAYLDPEYIVQQAQRLDQIPKAERGVLHGLAVGVKDVMNTQDMPTQYGSPIYKDHRPGFDASAVGILRAAGALIFGKTTTTEFTVLNYGPETTNPLDPARTPGGSSCGSAAAVADFQVPVSLGVQTGGSIIRPAAYTGIWGMKPTFDAISSEGDKLFALSFDTFGFFARTVEDLKLLADVYGVEDDEPPKLVPLTEMSIAVVKTPMWSEASQDTRDAIEAATQILLQHGAKVEQVVLPGEAADCDNLTHIQKVISKGEARVALLREYRVDKAHLAPQIRRTVENKANYTHKDLVQAGDSYSRMRILVDEMAAKYTVILTPSAEGEAPLGLDDMGKSTFNTMWTGFHMPVINVPAFWGSNDMPVGISLVAPRFHDQHLLKVSAALGQLFQQAVPAKRRAATE